MNRIILTGNLTRDPEQRVTGSGISVCSFAIAVNRRISKQDGEKQTDFFRINAWRQLGESCARYLAKGRKVAVVGELQPRAYVDRNGDTRLYSMLIQPSSSDRGCKYFFGFSNKRLFIVCQRVIGFTPENFCRLRLLSVDAVSITFPRFFARIAHCNVMAVFFAVFFADREELFSGDKFIAAELMGNANLVDSISAQIFRHFIKGLIVVSHCFDLLCFILCLYYTPIMVYCQHFFQNFLNYFFRKSYFETTIIDQYRRSALMRDEWTALDILRLDEMPAADRLWLALYEVLIDAPVLHEFACRCAERALSMARNPDPRSVAAIETKRKWLHGVCTNDELDAAEAVAQSAAQSATRAAAWTAAWAASRASARVAAWAAAEYAAKAAAWAADATRAAWAAEREWQVAELIKMLER